jgi:hypothetical protein
VDLALEIGNFDGVACEARAGVRPAIILRSEGCYERIFGRRRQEVSRRAENVVEAESYMV